MMSSPRRAPGGRDAILASHAAEQLEHNCPALILRFAFGYDVELEDGLVDRIIVLQAFNSGQIVGGIIREVPGDFTDLMRKGLEDKYGSDFYDAGTGDQIWLDTGSQAVFEKNLDSCTPRWPEYDLPSYYMTVNCGALIRWMYNKVMLVDTRYNSLQYQSFLERRAEAEAAKEPVKIEF